MMSVVVINLNDYIPIIALIILLLIVFVPVIISFCIDKIKSLFKPKVKIEDKTNEDDNNL